MKIARSLGVRDISGFIHCSRAFEAKPLIEPNCAKVLRSHFQVHASHSLVAKTLQGSMQQRCSQPLPAMRWRDSQILNRTVTTAVAHPLHRSAILTSPSSAIVVGQ